MPLSQGRIDNLATRFHAKQVPASKNITYPLKLWFIVSVAVLMLRRNCLRCLPRAWRTGSGLSTNGKILTDMNSIRCRSCRCQRSCLVVNRRSLPSTTIPQNQHAGECFNKFLHSATTTRLLGIGHGPSQLFGLSSSHSPNAKNQPNVKWVPAGIYTQHITSPHLLQTSRASVNRLQNEEMMI